MQIRQLRQGAAYLLGAGLLLATADQATAWGDDTGFLGRLFGNRSNASSSAGNSAAVRQPAPLPYGPPAGYSSAPGAPAPLTSFGGLPATPGASSPAGPAQHITPRSRVSPAVTSADPLITRMALGRSNDGSQFGMFLQVFTDGTVIDSEGVHHVRPADLKPIVDVIQSGEVYRVRSHCGAPSTDFIEYAHVVVYDRRFGRLMAHTFSYSGNPQGCDHVVRHLHTALENLQTKLSRPGSSQPTAAVPTSPGAFYNSPAAAPAATSHAPVGSPAGPVIPLTPAEPGR